MRLFPYMIIGLLVLTLPQQAFCEDDNAEVFLFEEEVKSDPSVELWEKGEIAIREKIYDSAIQNFEEFIKIADKASEGYPQKYVKAVEYIVKSHLMLRHADLALAKLNEKFGENLNYTLSNELRYSMAQAYVLLEQWENALNAIKPLAMKQTGPEGVQDDVRLKAIILAADCMMKLGQWKALAEMVEGYFASVASRQNFDLLYRLSEAYIALGNNTKAEENINMLATLQRNSANDLKYNMLFIRNLSLLGNAKSALEIFAKIATKMPNSPDNDWWLMLTALADSLYSNDMLDEAFRKYENAIAMASTLQQKMHASQYLFKICIRQNKRNDELLKRADEFQKNYPDSKELIEIIDMLARYLQKKGENNAAAEQFLRLTQLLPDEQTMYQAFFNAGECHAAAGNLENAIQAFLNSQTRGNSPSEKATALFRAAENARNICRGVTGDAMRKEYDRAIGFFKDVADKYPNDKLAPRARFAQAELLDASARLKEAAAVYGVFEKTYPFDPQREKAIYHQGICLRKCAMTKEDSIAAAVFLSEHANSMENQELSNDTRIEAFLAFKAANDASRAEAELTAVVKKPATREKHLEALFRRSMLRYEIGDTAGGRLDTDDLRNNFPGNKCTDQLCLFTGDTYANDGDWDNARKYYFEPTGKEHDGVIRPYAQYEAAFASYKMKDYEMAIKYTDALISDFEERAQLDANARELLSKAYFLRGDVFVSLQSPDYEKAQENYGKSAEYADDKDSKYASIGRRGDVFLKIAVQDQIKLQREKADRDCFAEAVKYYSEIIANYPMENPLGLMARYKKANALKSAKDYDNALKEYKDFYISFEQKAKNCSTMDAFYFANAVFEMTEILESKGDAESLSAAERFYKRLAEANLPTSDTARKRAEIIGARLDKVQDKK